MCSGGAFIDTGFQAGATRAPRRKPFKRLSHRVACSVLSASMSGVKSAGDSGRYNTSLRGLAPKELRDFHRVFRMRAHAPRQCAHPAQDQPAIERRGDRAAFVLNAADPLKKFIVCLSNDNSSENVAMPAEILGC